MDDPGADIDVDVDEDVIAGLVRAVEALRAERDEDRALLEELQIATASGHRHPAPARAYPDWVDWVEGWLTVRISRHPHRHRWCRHYGDHPEVADRLEALWHAWELQWPDPTARLSWFRDGLDHQLAVITAEDGPLRGCSAHERQHVPGTVLADLGDDA